MKKNVQQIILITLLLLPLMVNAQGNFYRDGWKAKSYTTPVSVTHQPLKSEKTPDAILSMNTSKELARVLPTHLGSNTTFRNGSDQLNRLDLYTNAGTGCMRFPAGSGSNLYFWDGHIPSDFRVDIKGIDGTNSNYMTPELFVDFMKQAGSQATVVVNYFYARYGVTPQGTREARVRQAADYAAGFVHKMNIELGANIQNWEVGNECYGKWEEGYDINGDIVSGKEYGEDFRVFAEAMKAVDPSIKVGAVVTRDDDEWNSQLLPEIKDHADFLAVHNYFTSAKDATPNNVLASVGQMETIFTTLQSCITKYTGKPGDYFPIAMTEYNSRGVYNTTMMNGLFITQIIGELIKTGYGMGTIWVSEWSWSATDQESKGILARNDPDQADYSPRHSYMAYQYFHRCFGDKMVEVASSDPEVKVYASTFTSGELGIVVVNPTSANKTIQLNMDGVAGGSDFNEAYWYDIYADDLNQGNKRFYINGQTGTTPGGGPDDFATLAPYYADYALGNTFESKKYSIQFIVLKADFKVATPKIDQDGAEITLSSSTSGAQIYYTTNGSEPNEGSTLYQNSFVAPPGTTIKAVAIKGGVSSEVSEYKLQYNVLFIAVDDLKPVLNCYGESQIISPNIDRLANRGVVFEKAYCQWSVCGPSRASILSGLTPDGTGIRNLSSQLRVENPGVITLPEYFKNKGYVTAAAGKIFDPRNVDDGHDTFSWTIPYTDPTDYTYPLEYGDFVGGKNYRVTNNTASEQGPVGVGDDGYVDGQIALDALDKMDGMATYSNRPFFLAVGFKKPHIPFVAPDAYWNLYNRSALNLAPYQQIAQGSPDYAYHNPEPLGYVDIPDPWTYDDVKLGDGLLHPDDQRKLIHGYYACVSYIDAQIGKLLNKLEDKGLDKNTVIVLLGDHGYHLGDHNQWGKHTQFENSVRAPLIISAPGGAVGFEEKPVEFTDIYPTLCDLAGLDIPQNKVQGHSLAPSLRGEVLNKTVAVSEYRAGGGSGYSFRSKRYRMSLWFHSANDRPDLIAWDVNRIKDIELFDYETDPLETKNLANDASYTNVKENLLLAAQEWWGKQYGFLTAQPERDLSLPFIEHFEDYAVGATFGGDLWMTENSLWDRLWKGSYVQYLNASVQQDVDNDGSNALKLSISALSKQEGGQDIKLRTKVMTEYQQDTYLLSYKARTNAVGANKASLGGGLSTSDQHILTQEYQYFFDTITLDSDRMFLYFNNSAFNTAEEYEIWIDDLKISYHYPTFETSTEKPHSRDELLQVYPNPFNDKIRIETAKPIKGISIYNISGVKVYHNTVLEDVVLLQGLPKGIYIVVVNTEFTKLSRKMIKM